MSLGSRGDMEPFLAKAEELKAQGDTVALCMPAQFESLAREVSDLWHPQDNARLAWNCWRSTTDVQNITGQIGSPSPRLRTMLRLMRETKGIQQQLIRDQKAAVDAFQPDRIVFHIKCIYPTMLGATRRSKVELLTPIPHAPPHRRGTAHRLWKAPGGVVEPHDVPPCQPRAGGPEHPRGDGGPLAREWGLAA